jgi:hypothetical protein
MSEIEKLLEEYYQKRRSLESSFDWKYDVKKKDRLTKKYSKKIENLNKNKL